MFARIDGFRVRHEVVLDHLPSPHSVEPSLVCVVASTIDHA